MLKIFNDRPPNMNLHVEGAGALVVTDLPFKVKKRSDTERLSLPRNYTVWWKSRAASPCRKRVSFLNANIVYNYLCCFADMKRQGQRKGLLLRYGSRAQLRRKSLANLVRVCVECLMPSSLTVTQRERRRGDVKRRPGRSLKPKRRHGEDEASWLTPTNPPRVRRWALQIAKRGSLVSLEVRVMAGCKREDLERQVRTYWSKCWALGCVCRSIRLDSRGDIPRTASSSPAAGTGRVWAGSLHSRCLWSTRGSLYRWGTLHS